MTARNWINARKREMLGRSALETSDLVRFRPIIDEHIPPPRSEIRDSRGRRISLPRVSILERADAVV